jgi:hypothetical protein
MKLTKTQAYLIKTQLDGEIEVTRSWGQGVNGGYYSDGARDLRAAFGLIKKGIVVEDRVSKYTDARGGYTTTTEIHIFRIINKEN